MRELLSRLLILDLDETLIYSTLKPLPYPADFIVNQFHVYKRPGLDKFLKQCAEHYQMSVWTAAQSWYADLVIERILPAFPLKFLWTYEHCSHQNHESFSYLKDIDKLRSLGLLNNFKSIVLLDNQPQNIINTQGIMVLPVTDFTGNWKDNELGLLIKRLLY